MEHQALTSTADRPSKIPATRLLIGVDGSPAGETPLQFALRLGFEEPGILLVNVVESPLPDGSFPTFDTNPPLKRWLQEREEAGWQMLDDAAKHVGGAASVIQRRLPHGTPAEELTKLADEENADLIVIGHNRRNRLDDVLFGSTARRLLHDCCHDVLIVRPTKAAAPPIAVFASDDSPESTRALERFLELKPKGVARIYVLTVDPLNASLAAAMTLNMPHLKEKAEEWIERGLREDAEARCAQLRDAGFDAVPLVVEGEDSARSIRNACDLVGASLIVLSSPPHGFWDRFINGSITETLLAEDSRSLLVLRP